MCICNRTIPTSDKMLGKKSVPVVLLISLLAGTSADIWMAVDLAITAAEQIRCSHTSQDHIIHSTENPCHSLTQSCPLSFSVSLSPAPSYRYSHVAHSHKTLIIKLEGTQGQCFIAFPKGKVENVNCDTKKITNSVLQKHSYWRSWAYWHLSDWSWMYACLQAFFFLCTYTFTWAKFPYEFGKQEMCYT